MTVVVSWLCKYGFVVVGDSRVSYRKDGVFCRFVEGAAKVQRIPGGPGGAAIWGNWLLGEEDMDRWLSRFIRRKGNDPLRDFGERLAAEYNDVARVDGEPDWNSLVGGVHLSGYYEGRPKLWHVHSHRDRPMKEPYAHERRLYFDIPEQAVEAMPKGSGGADPATALEAALERGRPAYLVNGSHQLFNEKFFAAVDDPGARLDRCKSLNDYADLLQELVRRVADELRDTADVGGVNWRLSLLAFNAKGVVIEDLIAPPTNEVPVGLTKGAIASY